MVCVPVPGSSVTVNGGLLPVQNRLCEPLHMPKHVGCTEPVRTMLTVGCGETTTVELPGLVAPKGLLLASRKTALYPPPHCCVNKTAKLPGPGTEESVGTWQPGAEPQKVLSRPD